MFIDDADDVVEAAVEAATGSARSLDLGVFFKGSVYGLRFVLVSEIRLLGLTANFWLAVGIAGLDAGDSSLSDIGDESGAARRSLFGFARADVLVAVN